MKVRDLNFDVNGEFKISIRFRCVTYDVIVYRSGKRFKLYVKRLGNELPSCDCFIPANHYADANCLIAYCFNYGN